MWRERLTSVVVAVALCAGTAVAAEPAGKPVETKRGAGTSAAAVDLAKELGVGFPSLATLGGRIEAARQSFDPVALAAAAHELMAAEKASGKTASVKSTDLAAEAVALATRRGQSAELKAVAALLPGHADAAKLAAAAGEAEKREAAEKAAKAGGEKSKGIMRSLHVDNRSPELVRVYIDGNYVGFVRPFGDGVIYVGQGAYETTILDGRGSGGGIWHMEISRPVADFTWSLLP